MVAWSAYLVAASLRWFFCQARLCCVWVPASARETVGLRGTLARARAARGKASLLLPITLCESVRHVKTCQARFVSYIDMLAK